MSPVGRQSPEVTWAVGRMAACLQTWFYPGDPKTAIERAKYLWDFCLDPCGFEANPEFTAVFAEEIERART